MSFNSPSSENQPTREQLESVFGHTEITADEPPVGHKTVYVESVDADIDEQIVDLVLQFNGDGAKTVSSCQGNPGRIGYGPDGEGGMYGHVCFMLPNKQDHTTLAMFLFGFLYNLTKDLWDDVRVEMTTSDDGFLGWVYFRNESAPELLRRLQDF
jgi:hypothetical protein